jgi:hypothetical protein
MSGSILGVGQTTHAETSDGTIPRKEYLHTLQK